MNRLYTFIVLLIVALSAPVANNAQDNGGEYKFKTVFIYNFTKYIVWPDDGNELVIGIYGSNPVVIEAFQRMAAAKTAHSKKLIIKTFPTLAAMEKCHILFIPYESSDSLGKILGKTKGNNTLVITEKEGMATAGSCINFINVDGKLKFEFNQAVAEEQGLKISSQLLGLAILV